MASAQFSLVANTVSRTQLDAPTTKIKVSITAGSVTSGEVYATADGNDPVIPTNGVEVPGTQRGMAAVLGTVIYLSPPLFGDHAEYPSVRLLSVGTPTVLVEW